MSNSFGSRATGKRAENDAALAAFGLSGGPENSSYRTIRSGAGPTVFTIGYEKRDSEDLLARLIDAGVSGLVDVRERPFSRKPDFRRAALEGACTEAGIGYQNWTTLGSTGHQRDALKNSGDFATFRKRFRELLKRGRMTEIEELAQLANRETVALICYERCHDGCHRSIVADFVANENDATVTAIL